MNIFKKLKRIIKKPSEVVLNQLLFSGCKNGDVELVQRAIELGADVNATKKVGRYSDGIGGRNNPSWQGTIRVTPLLYAATSAFGRKNEAPAKEIIRLLAENGARTDQVISGKEEYWEDDIWEISGYPPDKVKPYAQSLASVLGRHARKKHQMYNSPNDYCAISDSMAIYMAGLFDIPNVKGLPDRLKNKEAYLNDSTAAQREEREERVAQGVATGKPLTAAEVIKLRNEEGRKRLEANKLRLKLRQEHTR